jgi:hypothetical protein
MFRVLGMGGVAVDALLDLRGNKIDREYFTQIVTSAQRDQYEVQNESKGNSCKVTVEGLIVTKRQTQDEELDVKGFERDTLLMYSTIDAALKIPEVNRIGIIYEYDFSLQSGENANKFIYDHFVNFKYDGIPSNFTLKMAFKLPTKAGILKPEEKKDYYNVITQFGVKYEEGEPIEDHLFTSIDIQRYFHPPIKIKEGNLIKDHFHYATNRIDGFVNDMRDKGISLG